MKMSMVTFGEITLIFVPPEKSVAPCMASQDMSTPINALTLSRILGIKNEKTKSIRENMTCAM
jgi:hypothetical protein